MAWVAALNLGYFGVEFAMALATGSVSLLADSVDFLEDTSINLLILLVLGWSARRRARVGMLLAGILLIPAWRRPGPPGRSSTCPSRPTPGRSPSRAWARWRSI